MKTNHLKLASILLMACWANCSVVHAGFFDNPIKSLSKADAVSVELALVPGGTGNGGCPSLKKDSLIFKTNGGTPVHLQPDGCSATALETIKRQEKSISEALEQVAQNFDLRELPAAEWCEKLYKFTEKNSAQSYYDNESTCKKEAPGVSPATLQRMESIHAGVANQGQKDSPRLILYASIKYTKNPGWSKDSSLYLAVPEQGAVQILYVFPALNAKRNGAPQ